VCGVAGDEPIRVLRVIARLNVGGPALHVSYLTSELDRIGYETTLVAGRVGGHEGSMEYIVRERGIEPVYLPALQREVAPVADARAVHTLLRMIRELKPDVLHTHTAKAGAVGRAAARLAGVDRPRAVVHTFHGHVLRGYFGPAMTRAFNGIERSLARSTDALIAVSPEVRDDLVALGIGPSERIKVIRLGLDLDARTRAAPGAGAAERQALGLPPDRFLVGWLGRMTEIKRVDVLLDAFARLRAGGTEADLVLVGDGPLRPVVEAQAASLGIADHTHVIGFREDVAPIYAALDAIALTSANEGTPVAVIEALAAGVPAVSTDVGGVSDVVPQGEAGFLVPAGDAEAVADRLAQLAADPELRARFGAAGSAWVRERYSVPRLVHDIDELYRSLLVSPRVRATRKPSLTAQLDAAYPQAVRARIGPATKRLRILLLSQYFPPEVGATQSRMQSFAEYLHARGHEVTVIAEFPNHPFGVIPDRYRRHVIDDDRSNGYRVVRVWVKANEEKTQRTRLAFYLSYSALATATAPLTGRVDVVLATSPPLFTAMAGAALAQLKGAPFVLDVRDLWPAAAEALHQISEAGLMRRSADLAERWLYRNAAAVVAVTRPFCDHIDALRRRPPSTAFIPNGTLEMFFDAVPDDNLRASLGADNGEFLVTFAGTHGIAQALPSVLEAAPLLEGVEFAFVGDGPMKPQLEQHARDLGLQNVHFHQQVPMNESPAILASSDALLVPLSAHPTFAQFVPSKLVDFMAVGRPVVLAAAGEAARLVERAGAGIVVPPEDPPALADGIRTLAGDPDAARAMGRRGRAFAAGRLRSIQAARLEQVLIDAAERT
jgi:glycosyltransferase involved in cell wall biosynthesis